MAFDVRDNAARSRYELFDGDELVGIADYDIADGVAVIPHTEITRARRGQGLGAVLVRHTLDDLRRRGLSVVPHCWYVAQFIDENPDYRDLVAA